PTISRVLRETLFIQDQTRSLSELDFELYKKKSSYHYKRDETVLISNHPNEIDGIVDLETLNNLKDFSSCVINLEDKIKDKNLEFQEKKEKKIQEELSQLTTQVVNYIEDMMPPPFLRSMLIIPKDQLDLYKLH
ncbi:7237_t:CDS:1, partial [Funneliformis geosporum]